MNSIYDRSDQCIFQLKSRVLTLKQQLQKDPGTRVDSSLICRMSEEIDYLMGYCLDLKREVQYLEHTEAVNHLLKKINENLNDQLKPYRITEQLFEEGTLEKVLNVTYIKQCPEIFNEKNVIKDE